MLMKKIIFFFLLLFLSTAFAKDRVLNLFNWAHCLPDSVLQQFEKETGIKVNYSVYNSNQALYAKLKAGFSPQRPSAYDVVVPSTYLVQRLKKEGMLQRLDHSKIHHLQDLDLRFLNLPFDPGNQYSIPYMWLSGGLIVSCDLVPQINSWKDLWNPKFKGKIVLPDDVRDTFAIAFKALGYSINDQNPAHIKQAYLKLKALLPSVIAFVPNGTFSVYLNHEAQIGSLLNGDANRVIQNDSSFCYVYPKEGAIMALDNLVIVKNSPHLEEAYEFINFVLRPDVSKRIFEQVGFSIPNKKAIQLMSPKERANRVLNPLPQLLGHSETEDYVNDATDRLYLNYFEMLKNG